MTITLRQFLNQYFAEPVKDLFFPPVCFVCNDLLQTPRKIVCTSCFDGLDRFLSETTEFSDEKFFFRQLIILFEFNENLRQLIHLIKYQNCRGLAEYFAEEALKLLSARDQPGYQFIVPVPLHKQRLRERGYNQSAEIARHLSLKLNMEYQADLLLRLRNTATQTRFSRQERIKNVSNAFICQTDLSGKRLLLVDDVITTGSTVNECCSALLNAGAQSVDVLALANPRLEL